MHLLVEVEHGPLQCKVTKLDKAGAHAAHKNGVANRAGVSLMRKEQRASLFECLCRNSRTTFAGEPHLQIFGVAMGLPCEPQMSVNTLHMFELLFVLDCIKRRAFKVLANTADTFLCPAPPPRPAPAARETGPAVGGSQRLVRVARQKVGVACSRAKRATLNFFCSCASQKAPEPSESEPHTIRLTSACRASKPQPSLTAFPGQKESSKKKLARQKKSVCLTRQTARCPGFHPFFPPSEVPRAGSPNLGPQSPVWDPTRAAGVGLGWVGAG